MDEDEGAGSTTRMMEAPVMEDLSDNELHGIGIGGGGVGVGIDEQDTSTGSALANAKLSTKKKEALSQVPCKFFRANGCSAGSACPFAHVAPSETQGKAICQWYLKGNCRFGHRCALAHILPGQPMSMDRKNKRAQQMNTFPPPQQQVSRGMPQGYPMPTGAFPPPLHPVWPNGMPVNAPPAGFVPRGFPQDMMATQGDHWPSNGAIDHAFNDAAPLPTATAFGTSPFGKPGSHSLFYSDPSERRQHPEEISGPSDDSGEASEVEAEVLLPSSLSELLTPTELERRTKKRGAPLHPIFNERGASQSVPSSNVGMATAASQLVADEDDVVISGNVSRHAAGTSPVIKPSHAPGQSLPQGLAAGISRLHLRAQSPLTSESFVVRNDYGRHSASASLDAIGTMSPVMDPTHPSSIAIPNGATASTAAAAAAAANPANQMKSRLHHSRLRGAAIGASPLALPTTGEEVEEAIFELD